MPGQGRGSSVVRAVNEHIQSMYELGALSTGLPDFYRRLGWELWIGSTAVRTERGLVPTPEDDGGIMVLCHAHHPGAGSHTLRSVANGAPGMSGDCLTL